MNATTNVPNKNIKFNALDIVIRRPPLYGLNSNNFYHYNKFQKKVLDE